MASQRKATRKSAPSSENPQEVPPPSEDLRREWAEFHRQFCAEDHADALCLFLRVHRCIFDRIAESKIPQMVALNPLFARRFLSVCRKFQDGDEFDQGPKLWRRALDFYMTHGDQILRSLVFMAEAHILEDLPDALYDLEVQTGNPIDRVEFDAALDAIVSCLEELNRSVKGVEGILDFLYFNLARHFGVVQAVQNIQVSRLRDAAWKEYELRKRFALMQRRKKR